MEKSLNVRQRTLPDFISTEMKEEEGRQLFERQLKDSPYKEEFETLGILLADMESLGDTERILSIADAPLSEKWGSNAIIFIDHCILHLKITFSSYINQSFVVAFWHGARSVYSLVIKNFLKTRNLSF